MTDGSTARPAGVEERGERMPPADPERDPLFRGLIILMAVALVVMLLFNGLSKRSTAGTSADSAATETSANSSMPGMADQTGSTDSMSSDQMAAMHEKSMKAYPGKTAGLGGQVLHQTIEKGIN